MRIRDGLFQDGIDSEGNARVRLGGQEMDYRVGDRNSQLFYRIAELVDTVFRDYTYLI